MVKSLAGNGCPVGTGCRGSGSSGRKPYSARMRWPSSERRNVEERLGHGRLPCRLTEASTTAAGPSIKSVAGGIT